MKTWIKRILLIFIIIILLIVAIVFYYYQIQMKLDKNELLSAEEALSAGIKINDPKDDFVIFGSNKEKVMENNPSPYRLEYLDVSSVSVGADEKYLYYKVAFYDQIPSNGTKILEDKIKGIGCKLNIVDDKNKDLSILMTNLDYLWFYPSIGTYYFYNPTGIEEPESARFANQDHDSQVYGGAGTNYLIGAFPLEKLKVKLGDKVLLTFMMEAESNKYTHAAVDVLKGNGKMSDMIVWTLGTNKFTIKNSENNFYEKN